MNTTWGNVILYIASYLRQYDDNASLSSLSMVAFANPVGWAIGSGIRHTAFGTWLYHKVGGRLAVLIGLLIIIVGLVSSAFITNMYLFLFVYLGSTGFGPAVIVFPGMFLSWTCDPQRKGLLTGMVLGSYGIGGVFYALGLSFLVNPDNKTPEEIIHVGDQSQRIFGKNIASRVPDSLLICAAVSFVIAIPALLLMKDRSSRNDRVSVSSSIVPTLKNKNVSIANCPNMRTALKTWAMWNLFLYSFLSYIFPVYLQTQFKNFGQLHSTNDQLLSTIGALALFSNTCGRFFVSWLMDYATFKQISFTVCVIMTIMAFLIPYIVQWMLLYAICVCIVFLGYTCLFSPISLVCVQIFGSLLASDVFVIVHVGGTLASFMNIPLVLWVIDRYDYPVAFYVCGVCSGLATLCLFVLPLKYKWKDSLLAPIVSKV